VSALTVLVGVAVIGLLFWRITWTPEWTILTGNERARLEICRTVCLKRAWRVRASLRVLLRDKSPAVRIAAVEALNRRPDVRARLSADAAVLVSAPEPDVRARALEYLLSGAGDDWKRWAERAAAELADPEFRHSHPELTRAYVQTLVQHGDSSVVGWVLDLLERDPEQQLEPLRPATAATELARPLRERFLALLRSGSERARSFAIASLTAIDGAMRGYAAEDWVSPSGVAAGAIDSSELLTRFTVEAEWAFDIRPNFEIDVHDGVECLYLAEGAGGFMSWLQRENSTVDIGTGRFTFALEKDGNYQVWLRCWLENKCGNSTGMQIDGNEIGMFSDSEDVFRTWHWQLASPGIHLTAGRHTFDLMAFEDGVFVDKFVVLPAEEKFNLENPPPLSPLFDASLPSSLSFTAEMQHQLRGTTQKLTVWVRRNTEGVRQGRVKLTVPPPFEVLEGNEADAVFAPGVPVARSTFLVRVPPNAVAGEVEARAEFVVNGKTAAVGTVFLGVQFDWWTTGPLTSGQPRCDALMRQTDLQPAELADGWSRYPANGYDRYRRLNFEMAYGQSSGKSIFLYTEIDVAQEGDYLSLLTMDDAGPIFIDGRRVAGRSTGEALGEGLLMMQPCHLTAGRHRVFTWVWQSPADDPVGPDADRHTYNNWVFKWLLRASRHAIAPGIRGLLVPASPATGNVPPRQS